jgi:hypothetical protein
MRLASSLASAAASSESGRVAALPRVDPVVMDRAAARGNKVARQVAGRNLTRACSGPATRLATFAVVRCRGVSWSNGKGESGRPTEAQR